MNKGFSTLFMMVLLSVALISTAVVWQQTILFYEYAQERTQDLAHQQLLQGIILYTKCFYEQNWQKMMLKSKAGHRQEVIYFPEWFKDPQHSFGARIEFQVLKDDHTATISLFSDGNAIKTQKISLAIAQGIGKVTILNC